MPRIELIPPDYGPATREGTPTIDVCRGCAENFTPGEFIDQEYPASTYSGHIIGSVDVTHPTYEDWDYRCDCCDVQLYPEDD
jgi:hypothetical protein